MDGRLERRRGPPRAGTRAGLGRAAGVPGGRRGAGGRGAQDGGAVGVMVG